jgi:hypothetical protein
MNATRGTAKVFEATFLDMDGDPLTPGDATSTPKVEIFDPQGNVVSTAVGSHIGNGCYRWQWFVPTDAYINTEDEAWEVRWDFVSLGGNTKSHEQNFNVIDSVESTPEERTQMLIGRPNRSERAMIRLEYDPVYLELDVVDRSDQVVVHVVGCSESADNLKPTDPDRQIGKMVRDGQYVFWYDLPPYDVGEYHLFWGIRQTEVSSMEYEHQTLRVPPFNFWRLADPLLTVIDKLKKKVGWVQHYSDSDLLEYIVRGLGTVNQVRPNTDWRLQTIPAGMDLFGPVADAVLTAATIHALMSQNIMELELQFNFSGQTVTLDYNHDYGGIIGNFREIWQTFVETKPRLYRVACGPGVAGVRPYRYRNQGSRVYRMTGDDGYSGGGLIAQVFNQAG